MIESKAQRLICDGIGAAVGGRRKRADGTLQAIRGLFVADGAGNVRNTMYTFGVTGTPQGYAYAQAAVTALGRYDLSGKVVPVGETVHLSRLSGGEAVTPAALLAGEVSAAASDGETGEYAFEAVDGWAGQAVCWILVNAALLDALEGSVSCALDVSVHESVQADALTVALDVPDGDAVRDCVYCDGTGTGSNGDACTNCGGTGRKAAAENEFPTITITGTAPAGAAVYLDEYDDGMCMDCGGCGKVKGKSSYESVCGACGGSGTVTDSGGNGRTCTSCGGTGAVTVVKNVPCPTCGGAGKAQGAMRTETLTPWVMASATADENGAFTMTFNGAYRWTGTGRLPVTSVGRAGGAGADFRKYLVWTPGTDGTLTAAITSVTSNLCLAGDTLITLADGSQKRLDGVRPGDLLLAGDGTPTRAVLVRRGRWSGHHTLYRFSDGTVIDEIHAHRFFNVEQGFWQLLERWRIGDHARRRDGAEAALVSVERVDEAAEMFGLWTESRDYWANGLLSGETAANQALLADAGLEQAADMAASLGEMAILQLMGVEGGLLP